MSDEVGSQRPRAIPDASPATAGDGLLRHFLTAAGGTGTTAALGALGGVLIARALGPADRGLVAVAVLVGSVAGSLASGGVQFWIARTVARRGGIDAARPVVISHLVGTAAVGVVAVASMSLLSAPAVWLATTAVAVAWAAAAVLIAVPNGLRRVGVAAAAQISGAAVYLVVVTLLWWSELDTPVTVVLAVAISQVAVASVSASSAWRSLLLGPRRSGWGFHGRVVRETWPAAVSEVLALAAARVDVVIVAVLLDRADMGIYAVALSIAEMPVQVANAAALVALPWIGADDRRSIAAMHRRLLAGSVVVGAALAAAAPIAVPVVFGRSYAESGSLAPVLVVGAVVLGSWKLLVTDLSARGQNSTRAISSLVGLVVMASADLVLVPALGLVGAALGSVIGCAASWIVVVQRWRRVSGQGVGALVAITAADVWPLRRSPSR